MSIHNIHPAVGNRPVQRVVVEESTGHKWVNSFKYIGTG